MLAAYIDDSGSDPTSPVFVYAGFVASSLNWAKFSNAWDEECAQSPATPDFHMVRAIRLKGKDAYWGQGTEAELTERRDLRLMNLATIIKNHALFRIGSGLDWRNYERILKGVFPYAEDTPLFLGFVSILSELAKWHRQDNVPEKIDVYFDCQSRIQNLATGWYEFMLEHVDPAARDVFSGPPAFRHDTDIFPLKAADMLAWQIRRHVADEGEKANMRPELKCLLTIPHREANLPGPFLRELAKSYLAERAAASRSWGV